MRAILNDTQTNQLMALNTSKATFVPCWSDLNAVTISDKEFDLPEFKQHKDLVKTFNLKWVADATESI